MTYLAYCSIEGNKQGKFHGENTKGHEKHRWINVISFSYGVSQPHDVATGKASGKRQHQPVQIVKEWGPASPQLFSALINNESLNVVFHFTKTDQDGKEQVYHTIQLSGASIVGITSHSNPKHKGKRLENISLSYDKLNSTGHLSLAAIHSMTQTA